MRNQGFQVDNDNDNDNDNDPVEENIPDASVDVQVEDKPTYKDWGCNSFDHRKVDGYDTNRKAKIKLMGSQELTFTGCFLLFPPESCITNVILPNKK